MMAVVIIVVVVVLAFVGYVWWYSALTPEQQRAHQQRAEAAQQRHAATRAEKAKIGKVGSREQFSKVSGDGACPNCGGTSFTAKRSNKGKVAAGVLAPKTQVKCVTCGAMFKRG